VIIIDYNDKQHRQIIHACVAALKQGKVVAYPTETAYGLACDVTSPKAYRRLLAVKGRDFNKATHVIIPSMAFAKAVVEWSGAARKLAVKFWPGSLSLVLPLKRKQSPWYQLGGNSGTLGLRVPDNRIAQDLARVLKKPISATSANIAGEPPCYNAQEIIKQFSQAKYKPDIIIDAGRLKKTKPSTLVKVDGNNVTILRSGPISKKQIQTVLHDVQITTT
jgi:L-threonylcarbamoyladenylate synthase